MNKISVQIVIKQSRRTNRFKSTANCSQAFREPVQKCTSRRIRYLLLIFIWWWAWNYRWYTANKKPLVVSDRIIMVFCGHWSSFVWLDVHQLKKKGFRSARFLSGKPETNLLVIHSKSSLNNLGKVLQIFIYLGRKNETGAIQDRVGWLKMTFSFFVFFSNSVWIVKLSSELVSTLVLQQFQWVWIMPLLFSWQSCNRGECSPGINTFSNYLGEENKTDGYKYF